MEIPKIINMINENDPTYDMINQGKNPQCFTVCELIGVNGFSVQRFRDAGYDKHAKVVWIITRTGSKSAFCEYKNEELQASPHYIRHYDEPFDGSYAIFLFRLPEDADKTKLDNVGIPNLKRLTDQSLERLESGQLNPLEMEFAKKLGKLLGD